MKSELLQFISQHDDWKEQLSNLKIKVKEVPNYPNLYIFNYDIMADFSNPIVQEARGIILNVANNKIVCLPFRKFGNYDESYADKIDWESARVQEKVDGSIIKLYYLDGWKFATNSVPFAEMANAFDSTSFLDLIKDAHKDYEHLTNVAELNTNYTYIFELVHPLHTIVVHYSTPKLYHLATRDNTTMEYVEVDLGIEKPLLYAGNSLEEVLTNVEQLNSDNNSVQHEGFVVVDKYNNRVKVKSSLYFYYHKLFSSKSYTKKDIIELLLSEDETLISEICNSQLLKCKVYYYRWQLELFKLKAMEVYNLAITLKEEYLHDRKPIAIRLLKHNLSNIGFKAIDSNLSFDEVYKGLPLNYILRNVKDYDELL